MKHSLTTKSSIISLIFLQNWQVGEPKREKRKEGSGLRAGHHWAPCWHRECWVTAPPLCPQTTPVTFSGQENPHRPVTKHTQTSLSWENTIDADFLCPPCASNPVWCWPNVEGQKPHAKHKWSPHPPAKMLTAARQLARMLLLVEDMRVTEDSKEFGLFWAFPLQRNDFHLFPAL